MNIKTFVVGATLGLLPMLSQANVIYEWKSINNEKPYGVSLRMEFDDETFEKGEFRFDLSKQADPHGGPRPELGLVSMLFNLGPASGVYYARDYGFYGDKNAYEVTLNVNVWLGKQFMERSISASNFSDFFSMNSNGTKFTVNDFETDNIGAGGCDPRSSEQCGGAAGFMMRVHEVPEPASLALIGAGLFTVSHLRRKIVRPTH
jgi:hypothetical protein